LALIDVDSSIQRVWKKKASTRFFHRSNAGADRHWRAAIARQNVGKNRLGAGNGSGRFEKKRAS
jgi:hypothetical protein